MLPREVPDTTRERLSRPSAFTTQTRSANLFPLANPFFDDLQGFPYLRACMVSNILPVHFKPQMVVRMHQFMRQRILGVSLVPQMVLTQHDTIPRRETTGLHRRAGHAFDIRFVHVPVDATDLIQQEGNDGAWAPSQFP